MYRLSINGLELGDTWIAESKEEVSELQELGVQDIILPPPEYTKRQVYGAAMWYKLKKFWPFVDWSKELGIYEYCQNIEHYHRTSDKERTAGGGGHSTIDGACQTSEGEYRYTVDQYDEDRLSVGNWSELVLDSSTVVDVKEIQALGLLPKFMGEVAEACTAWSGDSYEDGYNKKLGLCCGSYTAGSNKPNLIIVDVSGSIPRGIAETLISLLDTMRCSADADLIVTGGRSMWIPSSEELPKISEIKMYVGFQGGNESRDFWNILKEHVIGRQWGNVIAFGDSDAPSWPVKYNEHYGERDGKIDLAQLAATEIDNLLCYWTWEPMQLVPTGYTQWAWNLAENKGLKWNWVRCLN